jgi:putative endonuclease
MLPNPAALVARLHAVLAALLKRPARAPSHNLELGGRGEDEAASFLRRNGYEILERNYRSRHGEIDLIAFRDGVVAFVEVRSRSGPAGLEPLESVTGAKRRRIIRTAHAYVRQRLRGRGSVELRFDVIGVLYSPGRNVSVRVHHVAGAFVTE